MPLHMDAFIPETLQNHFFADLLQSGIQKATAVISSRDKSFVVLRTGITDQFTGQEIGDINYTLYNNDDAKCMEVYGLDITLRGSDPASIKFLTRLPGSDDVTEYYEAECYLETQVFELETVNRFAVDEALIGSVQTVHFSVFPYKVDVFDDITAFNAWAGFAEGVRMGDTEIFVDGYSETFMMPGGTANPAKKEDEHFTYLLGKVLSFADVEVSFGEMPIQFIIAQVRTGLGVVPVAMHREQFDLTHLHEDSILAMFADISADLSTEKDWVLLQ